MKQYIANALIVPLFSLTLMGCAKKPPSCSDAETLNTISSIVVDNVKLQYARSPEQIPVTEIKARFSASMTQLLRDDPQDIKSGYFKGLKLALSNIVSDGYNEQAKRNSCRANLMVSTANGQQFSRDIAFTTQVSESKTQDFVVEVQAFQPFIDAVFEDLNGYYGPRRTQGEWRGTYRCAGIDGAKDGPQGPYQMPVSVLVDGQSTAKLERTTKGGGIEKLEGQLSPYVGSLELRGIGQNSPDDTWRTTFEGQLKGSKLGASGKVVTPEGRVLRQCALDLELAGK